MSEVAEAIHGVAEVVFSDRRPTEQTAFAWARSLRADYVPARSGRSGRLFTTEAQRAQRRAA